MRQQQESSLFKAYASIVVLLAVVGGFAYQWLAEKDIQIISALPKAITSELKILLGQEKKETLADVVEKELVGAKGSYAVAIINPTTKETYYKNEQKVYDSASLYKLWVMAETYRQIKEGRLAEGASMSANIADLNKKFTIASESAELQEGTVQFTIGSALRQMITISHNYAALMLSDKVRLGNVKRFIDTSGFTQTDIGENGSPETTAYDTALFFEKLLNGQIVDKEYSDKMLALLKMQKLNNKLPKYLPKEREIAHKTGELGYVSHDAGIMYTPKGPVIIVVLSETTYPPGAEERIAKIAQAVYAYSIRDE